MKLRKDNEIQGIPFRLEDERMRPVREDPRSATTTGFEEGEQVLTPRLLQSSQVRTSGDSRDNAAKSSEIRRHEITWIVDLRIYRDPP
jgi:hypothetical protein